MTVILVQGVMRDSNHFVYRTVESVADIDSLHSFMSVDYACHILPDGSRRPIVGSEWRDKLHCNLLSALGS